jgi:hypothetical protein
MPIKTDRILGYLPGTFRAQPRPTALYSVADAFGQELLQAENTLAAVMRSHWVDHADQGEEFIDDLARIASLYGLAPRDDENVEEFRAHLKRYVRTFLEGTSTVQGILRLTAETLALIIADAYSEMDGWWMRATDGATTVHGEGDDAIDLLFGRAPFRVRGRAVAPARLRGAADLSGGVDLRPAPSLVVAVDGGGPVTIDLGAAVPNAAKATLSDVVAAINAAVPAPIAAAEGSRLVLSSPTAGAAGTIAVLDTPGDAAVPLLGLHPRHYAGADRAAAEVTGAVDLAGGVDLSDRRYLRLLIDGTALAEIDCGGSNPAATSLDEIVAAINGALGSTVASHDGHLLTLRSPTAGASSTIHFESPAAQDCTAVLLGPVNAVYTGHDQLPATVTGSRDASKGLDLATRFNIAVSFDDGAPLAVKCAGANAKATQAPEIASAINAAAGQRVASQDGRFITLSSPTTGPGGSIAFHDAGEADATSDIFGIAKRDAAGQDAAAATLASVELDAGGVDIAAVHRLQVAVDDGTRTLVDFWDGASDRRTCPIVDLAAAINAQTGSTMASAIGRRLVLASPTAGASSSVAVAPLERTVYRRFVTRAFVVDEAAQRVLGVFQSSATGSPGTSARVTGTADLSRGVDLRADPFLQISVDGGPPALVDCSAGVPRPRVALPDEIVRAINRALGAELASQDGRRLTFASPTPGAGGRIEFQSVLASDAADSLGFQPATVFGEDSVGVVLVGTVDIGPVVDLQTASNVTIAVDGNPPVTIDCAGTDPAKTTVPEIVTRINAGLGAVVASASGGRLVLTSPTKGKASRIELLAPSSGDATKAIFAVGPRAYRGEDAAAPQIAGQKDVSAGVDLRNARLLHVGFDGGALAAIDVSAGASDRASVKPAEIVAAINAAAAHAAAATDGKHIILKGPTARVSGNVTIATVGSEGAFRMLMGTATMTTTGADAVPATIVGTVDLLAGVNLDERRVLRLSVDGARPIDVDISGAKPAKTFLDEIVNAINGVHPGLASASPESRLVLTSPTAGEHSRLDVLPIRMLELIEYPPATAQRTATLSHGQSRSIVESGAADSDLTIEVLAPQGAAGVALVNRTAGTRVRVMAAIDPGGMLRIRRDQRAGIAGEIVDRTGASVAVPAAMIVAGPIGLQVPVPDRRTWNLRTDATGRPPSLQLNNPYAAKVNVLRALRDGPDIGVLVLAAAPPAATTLTIDGNGSRVWGLLHSAAGQYSLRDAGNATLAIVRAGDGVDLPTHVGRVVLAQGTFYPGEANGPLLVASSIEPLMDVRIEGTSGDGNPLVETYTAVTIGVATPDPASLAYQLLARPSGLLTAEDVDRAVALRLPVGRSDFSYVTCDSARFDAARFDAARYPGGPCVEEGVLDVSRFADGIVPEGAAIFADDVADPPVQMTLSWSSHQPGAFTVNLPEDLPEKFGARFDRARFGREGQAPEVYENVVTEPEDDGDFILKRLEASSLVQASRVERVPIGFVAQAMPFHRPRHRALTGGTDTKAAAIYITEPGVPGVFELKAIQPGVWGNTIDVSARKASPARFQITIGYQGARFENARETVFAGRILRPGEDPLPTLTDRVLEPRPVGVLQGKAAGILARVTRDRAGTDV